MRVKGPRGRESLSAREEGHILEMKNAREEFFRRLARLQDEED
jgi:hypothetical protein